VASLAESQKPLSEEILGPPVKAAFDSDGNPTKAALGFARTNGVDVPALGRKDTPKGERLFFQKKDDGEKTEKRLLFLAQRIVSSLPSPKSMRWGDGKSTFVRPIHWLLLLFGGQPLSGEQSFTVQGAESPEFSLIGTTTRGHRFMGSREPIEVSGYDDYLKKLRKNFVEPIVDDGKGGGRIPIVREAVTSAAANANAELAAGPEEVERLIEKVAHLVEWPTPVVCSFDARFLDLPEEVTISTLETHQRCFALRTKGGGPLEAKFIGVSNTEARDMNVVAQGYERVVRARLEDAEFYWKQDLNTSLDEMAEGLKGVVYHPRLGTSWEKVERFRALSVWLAGKLFPSDEMLVKRVDEAARLCKADLTSGMVYEFPELQGLMGSYYAERAGIDPEVGKAIFEHYLPRGEGDTLPASMAGAIVGLADRMDTLAGMIGLGYVPSGSEDPFALRRAANAIVQILLGTGYRVSLAEWANKALEPLNGKFKDGEEAAHGRMMDFLRNRVSAGLARSAGRADIVEAVLSAGGGTGWHDPVDAAARLRAVEKLAASSETFEPLTTTFKRVSNIIRQAEGEGLSSTGGPDLGAVSPDLLAEPSEINLYEATSTVILEVNDALSVQLDLLQNNPADMEAAYVTATSSVATLRPAVDSFFDDVLVMAEDENLRRNRLALLAKVGALFAPVADFSKIQGRATS
jgi:glycyl-tRNA synthetase beta chain